MKPGDVWQVDLGLAGKVRPALVLSQFPADDELALVTIVPHTTALRGNRWEVAIGKPFLQSGAFHVQQVQSVPTVRLLRRLGSLSETEIDLVHGRLQEYLGMR